jgi:hypothetical protein
MDEVHSGAFGVVEDPEPPLTAEEVAILPEMTPVIVIWSGGNGPHRYRITVNRYGTRHAWVPLAHNEQMRFYNPLDHVGQERFHTRVWLARD